MALAASDLGLPTPEEELKRLKAEFLTSLDHEVRTPLNGILGMTDLLLETPLSDQQSDCVRTARACAEELLEQLNCAIEFSDLASGRFVLCESEFNLIEFLESVAAEYSQKCAEKGLGFQFTLAPDLPAEVYGDAVRLRRMLSHLLGNAVKFTTRGDVGLQASAGSACAGRLRLKLQIRDSGIGMAPEQLAHVFDALRQGENGLSRRYPGLGLGLALVAKLANAMRGEVSVASVPGEGSVLTAAIPLRVPELTPEGTAAPKGVARVRRVLVVDNDPVSRRVVTHILARGEYQIESAAGLTAAVQEAARHHYDAVLLELHLPGTDGFEAVRRIHAIPGYAGVPVIALTCFPPENLRPKCLGAGMREILAKPVDGQRLLSVLERLLP